MKASLKEFGLTQKEAEVYLAMLELGPASVQDIAKKAGVNRTTTYVMLEALQRRGLMSSFEKGKKLLFNAENPQRLMSLLVDEMSHVKGKQDRLSMTLPKLLAVFNANDAKPRVRYFDSDEALDMVRQEIAESRREVWEVYAVNEAAIQVANIYGEKRIEHAKRASGRLLMAIKPGLVPPYFDSKDIEARTIDYDQYPFSGNITIVGHHVYILSAKAKAEGIIVESKEISELIRALYEIAWRFGMPWMPPTGWGPTAKANA